MSDLHDVPAVAPGPGHLSRDELIVWRDEGAGDRTRIVAHLAACGACRRMAASLERIRPPEAAPARFDPADFVAQGYAARQGGAASRSWRFMPLAVAAAAALLVAAMLLPAWLRDDRDSTPVQRGSETRVTLTRPVGITVPADALIFEWRADSRLDSARLLVFDLDRPSDPLIRRDVATTATRYEPTTEERLRLPRGRELHWFIEYRIGGSTATTPAARFRVE